MPNLYEMALMLVRLLAGMNMVFGITCLIGVVLVLLPAITTHGQPLDLLLGVITYLADFGVAAVLGGAALALFSKRIARYASKQ